MTDIYETGIRIWARWTEMWNGHPELVRELVAERFALHVPLPSRTDPAKVTDPASVERWVVAHCALFERLTFHYDAGPFVDTVAGVVAGPWWAEAIVEGKARVLCGMDTIAFRDGKITEYWTLAKEVETVGRWTEALAAPRG
jgi:hypothetical protein